MQASESPWDRVQRRLKALGIQEQDLEETFVLGSGSGGQKVNKTAQAVQLIHLPSRKMVKCSQARSQYLNRLGARERLCELLEQEANVIRQDRMKRRARIRFQNRMPSANQSAKRVGKKRQRGEVKQLRRRPGLGD